MYRIYSNIRRKFFPDSSSKKWGVRKSMKTFSHDNFPLNQKLNLGSPEYEVGALTT
jgi:hypothetical protein